MKKLNINSLEKIPIPQKKSGTPSPINSTISGTSNTSNASSLKKNKINPLYTGNNDMVELDLYDKNNDLIDLDLNDNKTNTNGKYNLKINKVFASNNLNVPWNTRIQLFLKKLGDRAIAYKWMHNRERHLYTESLYKLNISLRILMTILGLLDSVSVVSALNDSFEDKKNILIIFTILNLLFVVILGILNEIKDNGDYIDKINNNKEASIKFSKFIIDIQSQLSLNIKDREPDTIYIRKITKTYDKLMNISPHIRSITMNEYMQASDLNNINKPIFVGGSDNIDIVIHDDLTKIKSPHNNKTKKNKAQNYEIEKWVRNF